MNKYKRIILVGKGAAGKDYARKILSEDMGMKYGVSYTTRPAREEEIEGVDYYFKTIDDFQYMDSKNEWYEYVQFNGWLYGTTKAQFYDNCNVFIMTPSGLSHLNLEDRNDSFVLYFEIPEDIRRERMLQRKGNADDVERRLKADEKDFANFINYNYMITDPNYHADVIYEIVRREMATKLIQRVENG